MSGGIDTRTGRQDYQIEGSGNVEKLLRFMNQQMERLADENIIDYDFIVLRDTWCNWVWRLLC